jgi:hypothetical protein
LYWLTCRTYCVVVCTDCDFDVCHCSSVRHTRVSTLRVWNGLRLDLAGLQLPLLGDLGRLLLGLDVLVLLLDVVLPMQGELLGRAHVGGAGVVVWTVCAYTWLCAW